MADEASLTATPGTRPTDPVGRVLYTITRLFAVAGGFVLCAMSVLTTLSVTGRSAIDTPIPGDFELMAVGTGVGVFLFLPYTQLLRENVIVDFFLDRAPFRVKSLLDALGSLVYGVLIALMSWRTSLGGVDLYHNGETTMILQVPRWSTFPLAILCLLLLLAVCTYTFWRSVEETRRNRPL